MAKMGRPPHPASLPCPSCGSWAAVKDMRRGLVRGQTFVRRVRYCGNKACAKHFTTFEVMDPNANLPRLPVLLRRLRAVRAEVDSLLAEYELRTTSTIETETPSDASSAGLQDSLHSTGMQGALEDRASVEEQSGGSGGGEDKPGLGLSSDSSIRRGQSNADAQQRPRLRSRQCRGLDLG